MNLQPFTLTPDYQTRIWGGDRIGHRFLRQPAGSPEPIGESWEIYGELIIRDGPYRGLTLNQLTADLGARLLGSRGGDPRQGFPLLVKWLDCRDWLSLQLHPDDATARAITGKATERGKSECWFFLEVEPGAEIIHGLRETPAPEGWVAVQARDWLELAIRKKPAAGEWAYIPAGTVHALGPGLLLLEVQQSSDLTYRLYDWDRVGLDGKPRPLHLAEARRVLEAPSPLPPPPTPIECMGKVVVSSPYFVIEEVVGNKKWQPQGSFEILTVLEGTACLSWAHGSLNLKSGDSTVIPADSPAVRLEIDSPRSWVRVRRP